MPRLIDTHCHLDSDIYVRDLDIVVRHAMQDEIWMVTVGNDYASSKRAVEIAEKYEGVYAAIGLHPLKVRRELTTDDQLFDIEKFRVLAQHPKVVAIGETGLDFQDVNDDRRPGPMIPQAEIVRENQKKAFVMFLELSRELRLPLMLHCRDAHGEMLDILETWDKTTPGFDSRGIVHCFSGNWKDARRYYNLDFLISFTGIMTHGAYQTEVLKKSPTSRIAVESDCPFLTPVAWSIRRNEPSYLMGIADAVAGIRGTTTAEIEKQTTENALRVFKRLPR